MRSVSGVRLHGVRVGMGMAMQLGLLVAFAACVESKTYQPPPPADPTVPTVPTPRLPQNDAYEGSTVLGKLQPTFVWEASTVEVGELTSYELQYSADKAFATGVVTVQVTTTSHQPAKALDVSTVPPVGRRYYWRVRACNGELCSEYSRPWWVNVGRSMKDFNGDGYDDVLVGGHTVFIDPNATGRAFVYFGGAGMSFDPVPEAMFFDSVPNSWFGASVSTAGDFNGDGFADVLIGAPNRGVPETNTGMAYLCLGGPGIVFDNVVDVYFVGRAAEARFGEWLSSAGDVNGDGYSDVVIGSSGSGETAIFFGSAIPPNIATPAAVIPRDQVGFYAYVAGPGDINGDGFADILVSGSLDPVRCAVNVYTGGEGTTFDIERDGEITGSVGEQCRMAAVAAGDTNGDGFSDILAKINDRGEGVRLFLGGKKLPTTVDVAFTLPSRHICRNAASIGDVNGDGAGDIAFTDKISNDSAQVLIHFGRKGAASSALVSEPAGILDGTYAESLFGFSLAGAGDLNGDGFDDIIVGDQRASSNGQVKIYLGNGGATFNPVSDRTLTGDVQDGYFGFSIAAL